MRPALQGVHPGAGPYQDPDGADKQSYHLLGYDEGGRATGLPARGGPGVNYPEPSIGRVVTAKEARGNGTGRLLVAEGLARCQQVWPDRGGGISAQAHLQRFTAALGLWRCRTNTSKMTSPHRNAVDPPVVQG